MFNKKNRKKFHCTQLERTRIQQYKSLSWSRFPEVLGHSIAIVYWLHDTRLTHTFFRRFWCRVRVNSNKPGVDALKDENWRETRKFLSEQILKIRSRPMNYAYHPCNANAKIKLPKIETLCIINYTVWGKCSTKSMYRTMVRQV